jgi:hypothetical protein
VETITLRLPKSSKPTSLARRSTRRSSCRGNGLSTELSSYGRENENSTGRMNLCDRIGLTVAELSRSALMNNVTLTAHELRQRAVYHRERATDTSDAAQNSK